MQLKEFLKSVFAAKLSLKRFSHFIAHGTRGKIHNWSYVGVYKIIRCGSNVARVQRCWIYLFHLKMWRRSLF